MCAKPIVSVPMRKCGLGDVFVRSGLKLGVNVHNARVYTDTMPEKPFLTPVPRLSR